MNNVSKQQEGIPHISKEQVLVRFESFWYNFGTILSESTLRMLWYICYDGGIVRHLF